MELLMKDKKKKMPNKINDDLNKYKKDPRFLKKLEEDNKWLQENGGVEEIYEALRQLEHYDTPTLELAVACEPQAEYGAPKKTEE